MYIIGLDIGTTATKALVLNDKGVLQGSGYQEYKLETKGDRVEQNPGDWWLAVQTAIKQATAGIDKSRVTAMGISTQGATMLAVDKEMKPIGSAITWLDTRAKAQTDKLRLMLGDEYVYRTTGWKLSPSLDAAKILYMKENSEYKNACMYISTLEYINFMLTGHAVIDPTNAGIRQIFSVRDGKWDEKIMSAIEIEENELPEIMPAGTVVGTLTSIAAELLGLKSTVKVYNGAHDQYCASIGSGAVESGDMLISTGTTWAVMGISQKPLFTESCIAGCVHPVKGLYGNMVSLAGSGTSYQWIKNSIFSGESFSEIDGKCEKRIGKNHGLFFLPWLAGALYPFWNPNAKGGFVGADLSTDKYDFALSVMESAVFNVKSAIEDFSRNGCKTKSIRVMGGATRSSIWMNILRCVLDIPVRKMNVTNTCAIGAASIALCAEGCFANYKEAAEAMVESSEITDHGMPLDYYSQKYCNYKKMLEYMNAFYAGE